MAFSFARLLLLFLSVTSAWPVSLAVTTLTLSAMQCLYRGPSILSCPPKSIVLPPCPAPQTGYISVASNDTSLNGFLAADLDQYGVYGLVIQGVKDALRVSFCPDEAAGNNTFNLYIASSDNTSDLRCLGAESYGAPPSDIDAGTQVENFAALERTSKIARGPAAMTDSSDGLPVPSYRESSIWTTDPHTTPMPLTPVWTNRDGNSFSYNMAHANSSLGEVFLFGGMPGTYLVYPVSKVVSAGD